VKRKHKGTKTMLEAFSHHQTFELNGRAKEFGIFGNN